MKKHVPVAMTAALVFISFCACAGTLRIGQPQVDGNQVSVPVLLEGDVADGVASLSFQLNYDPSTVEPQVANPGAAAQSAGKNVTTNVKEPGTYMVVMSGLNSNTIASGEVTSIVLQRRSDAASTNISITGTAFASLQGDEIPSRGSTGNISFEMENQEEDETDEEPDTSQDEETPATDNTTEEQGTADPVPFDATNTDPVASRPSGTSDSSESDNALIRNQQPGIAAGSDSQGATDASKEFAEALTAAAASRSTIGARPSATGKSEDTDGDSPAASTGAPTSNVEVAAITEETTPPQTDTQSPTDVQSALPVETETDRPPAATPSPGESGGATDAPQTQEQQTEGVLQVKSTPTLLFLIVAVVIVAAIVLLRRHLFS